MGVQRCTVYYIGHLNFLVVTVPGPSHCGDWALNVNVFAQAMKKIFNGANSPPLVPQNPQQGPTMPLNSLQVLLQSGVGIACDTPEYLS